MANATTAIQQEYQKDGLTIPRTLTVATGVTIYQGTLVGIDAGEGIVAATNKIVGGIAVQTALAGEVVTCNFGMIARFAMSGAAITDIGGTAYAADNQTATTGANTAILGPIVDVGTDEVFVLMTTRA